MTFKLTIKMDNAAFADDGNQGFNEVARILQKLASEMEDAGISGRHLVFDINGNTVGEAKVTK